MQPEQPQPPITPPQPPVSPPQPAVPGAEQPAQGTNTMAIIGLICAFVFPLAGLVVSILALNQIKKTHQSGKGLAITGLVLSIIFVLIVPILFLVVFLSVPKLQETARDTERKADISSIAASLENYKTQNGNYPTLDQLNDSSFRSTSLSGTSTETFRDPAGTDANLTSSASHSSYAYQPTGPNGETCDNTKVKCAKFTLTALLENGTSYVQTSQ